MTKKIPTAFLDRDGVINVDANYVHTQQDFQFIPGVFSACRKIIQCGYQIIVITNQAGIARGFYTEKTFTDLTEWMQGEFERRGIKITDVYFCPHHPEHGVGVYKQRCAFRKPEPGMLKLAAREHQVDFEQSFLVGDKMSDIVAGERAGVARNYLVETGKPIPANHTADAVFADLAAFADFLQSQQQDSEAV